MKRNTQLEARRLIILISVMVFINLFFLSFTSAWNFDSGGKAIGNKYTNASYVYQNVTNPSYNDAWINGTIYNKIQVNDINTSMRNYVNSIASYSDGWINSTIDNKILVQNTSLNNYITIQNNSLINWVTSTFASLTTIVNAVGNWSADKVNYYTKTEVNTINTSTTNFINSNNQSLVNYILYVNTTNGAGTSYVDTWINGTIDSKILTNNNSVINWISNTFNATRNNYALLQNNSLVNYILVVNTSMKNYVDSIGETKWNANYSQFLLNNVSVTNSINSNNLSMNNFINSANTTIYQILNNGSYLNVASDTWIANYSSYYTKADINNFNSSYLNTYNQTTNDTLSNYVLYVNSTNGVGSGISWATATNGTLFLTSQWNSTNTSYLTGDNASIQNQSLNNYINSNYYNKTASDSRYSHGNLINYLSNTSSSDVANYLIMNSTLPQTSSEKTYQVSGVSDGNTLMSLVNSNSNITFIEGGVVFYHLHMAKTIGAPVLQVYTELYKRASNNAETLISTSETSETLLATEQDVDLHGVISDSILDVTDRLVVKIKAVGGMGLVTVNIYTEGTTGSRMELPVPVSSIQGTQGIQGISGTNGSNAINYTDWNNNFTAFNNSWSYTYNSTENASLSNYIVSSNNTLATWVDNLFVRFTELVEQVGNWSLDKASYTPLTTLNNGSYLNIAETDSKAYNGTLIDRNTLNNGTYIISSILNNGSYFNPATSDTFIGNYSLFKTHITFGDVSNGTIWSWVMNGSVMHPSDWNATNTSYMAGDNFTLQNTSMINWISNTYNATRNNYVLLQNNSLVNYITTINTSQTNYDNAQNTSVTNLANTHLDLAGGTMTGQIQMNANINMSSNQNVSFNGNANKIWSNTTCLMLKGSTGALWIC